ncbi:MAG: carboxypeptidase-like regulatory domain-containing protein [Bryobacteraceae bacterium]|nr:carboxypeptidase-like regulatory domain-containing protein [Bryobacteraceae bacterium]
MFAIAALCAVSLNAQSTFGVILGTVTDASGAVVTKAAVRVTNAGESTSREAVTDANGNYEFQNLKPGQYRVAVTATGFQTFAATLVPLNARQTVRVDATLTVGEVSQSVEVTSAAGIIATDTPVIASTLSVEKVASLPANVRAGGSTSPYNLIATLPGVQPDNGNGFGIQGGIPAQSDSSLDGISITNATGNSPLRSLFPSVESIAEIKVQGVGNTAEYGTPGDITTISKSGNNSLHGAAFWYHQNRAMDSRSFGQAALPAKVGNSFGGTLGGPVFLPKLYDGRNKTFFFTSWESFRFPRQTTVQNSVPTERMKNGDFTQEGVTVRDPLTGQPFAGNVIPNTRINSVARAVLPYYPRTNIGAGERFTAANFIENRSATIESDQLDVRGDHQFTPSHSFFSRYSWKQNPSQSPNVLLLPTDTVAEGHHSGVASYTWSIRPTLLNEFRAGVNYSFSERQFPFEGREFLASLNLRDIPSNPIYNGIPAFQVDRLTSFAKGRPGFSRSWNTQFIDNMTWIRGRHTFKWGIDVRRLRAETNISFITGDSYGEFAFNGNFTGHPWGDFLLGAPVQSSIADLQIDNDGRATHYKAYIQDSFRVSSKLTLDYGLRWEFHPGYIDAGLNTGNFDRNVPVTGRVIIQSDPRAPSFIGPGVRASINACPGQPINGVPCTPIVTADEAGLPEGLRENYFAQFLPRVGLAYRLNDKTTLRASGGLYNMIVMGSVFFSLTSTVQADVRSFNNVGPDGRPIFFLPNTRTSDSGVRSSAVGTFEFRTANQIDFRPPRMLQWSLSVDRQLNETTGLRLSYIGNKSTHMPWAPDINQPLPSTRFFTQRPLTDRPFPNWGLIYSRDAGANSIYNSLQAEVNRRFAKGLTFTFAYTLAKHLGDNAGPNPSGWAGETGGGRVTNSLDRRADRGDIYATRRHRALTTLLYELPFGRGRQFLANSNRFVDGVLGGWTISSILTLQTGPYLTPVFSGGDPSGTNAPRRGTQRPDRIGEANGSRDNPTAASWLDRSAFVCPGRTVGAQQFDCSVGVVPGRDPAPIGRFGNSGVGIVLGPGTVGWNLGLSKRFLLVERVSLRMEGTFTNVPNRVNLADPNLNIADSNFGRITSARGGEVFGGGRTGQVSMRLEF